MRTSDILYILLVITGILVFLFGVLSPIYGLNSTELTNQKLDELIMLQSHSIDFQNEIIENQKRQIYLQEIQIEGLGYQLQLQNHTNNILVVINNNIGKIGDMIYGILQLLVKGVRMV